MNRLRAYRSIEGINQEDLGEILGLSPQMVSAIESGRRPFLGDLALIGYAPERLTLPDMSTPMHRQRASTKVAARNRAQELLRLAGEVFAELRDRTPKSPVVGLEIVASPGETDELENTALDVRAALRQDDNGPIRNLTAAVERAGVCLVPMAGLFGVDGLSSWVDGVPVIGLSPSVPGDRFRLTVGHEIGHLTLHTRKTETTETEANRFAGALLFPIADFDAAIPERPLLRDFIALKSTWGVSVAALVYRAHELGYVDDQRYRALQIQMAKWRKREPGTFEPVHGELLGRLVEVNGGVAHVAEELGVNRDHLAALVDWRRLRLMR